MPLRKDEFINTQKYAQVKMKKKSKKKKITKTQ